MDTGATIDKCAVPVVDDDPDIREMLCELVESESCCVAYPAEHGRQALEVLAALPSPPCLILLDLTMPVMNGWEVLGSLAADAAYGKVPVTVITASNDMDLAPTGDLLRKPFTITDLRRLLDTHRGCADAPTEPQALISRIATLPALHD